MSSVAVHVKGPAALCAVDAYGLFCRDQAWSTCHVLLYRTHPIAIMGILWPSLVRKPSAPGQEVDSSWLEI